MAPLRVQMTRHKMAWGNLLQAWDFLGTDVHGMRTTRVKFTALWRLQHIAHRSRDWREIFRLGVELSKPIVYGCNGCANNSFFVPSSTRCEAYMTPIVSHVCATTPKLWVMKIKDMLKRSIMLRISSRMVA